MEHARWVKIRSGRDCGMECGAAPCLSQPAAQEGQWVSRYMLKDTAVHGPKYNERRYVLFVLWYLTCAAACLGAGDRAGGDIHSSVVLVCMG